VTVRVSDSVGGSGPSAVAEGGAAFGSVDSVGPAVRVGSAGSVGPPVAESVDETPVEESTVEEATVVGAADVGEASVVGLPSLVAVGGPVVVVVATVVGGVGSVRGASDVCTGAGWVDGRVVAGPAMVGPVVSVRVVGPVGVVAGGGSRAVTFA